MENLKLETVNMNHAGFINNLMNDSTIKIVLHEPETNLDDWINAIHEWQNDLDEEDYIILNNNEPIGWIAINGLLSTNQSVYLKMLVLKTNYQNKGIGTFVLKSIIKYLKERNYQSILLYTDKSNVKAQKCYKKCGFKVIDSIIEQMSDQSYVERYSMKLDLIEKEKIRDILIVDFTQEIFQNAFKLYFKELGIDVKNWDALFQEMSEERDNKVYIRMDNDEIVGFIMFKSEQLSNWFFEENFGFIREFWVAEKYRKNGHGSHLLKLAEDYFRENKIFKIILTTDTAKQFYETQGYHLDKAYIAKNEDEVFVKNL